MHVDENLEQKLARECEKEKKLSSEKNLRETISTTTATISLTRLN